MKEFVVGFYMKYGKVLLIQKNRPEWQKGKFNGVGGGIEPGETPIAAMNREFKEETGLDLGEDRWFLFARLRCGATIWFFVAGADPNEDAPRTTTDEVVSWHPLNDLPQEVVSNVPWLLEMANMRSHHDWPYDITEKALWECQP